MDTLTPEDREFIGFFMGEGCLMIQKVTSWNSKRLNNYYRPLITISLRDDDYRIIENIKRRFGGQIERRKKTYYKNTTSNPRCSWRIIGYQGCEKVYEILSQVLLPYKKVQELEVFKQFLNTKIGIGRIVTEELLVRQKALKEKLSSLKKYSSM